MKRFLIRWRSWPLLMLGLGALAAGLVYHFSQTYDLLESSERERLTIQSKVIEENLSRQLVAIDLAMESLIAELPQLARQPGGQDNTSLRLKSMEVSMPSVRTFTVMDALGDITASNRTELVGRNFAQREYFQVHVRAKDARLLHVSEPFVSALNNYVVILSRAILGPDNELQGVVTATIDPVDIQILLNSVRYADDMRAMLVHSDGVIFVSQPSLPGIIGLSVAAPGTFFRQHLESMQAVTSHIGKAPSTGDQRLSVLRTINPASLSMDHALVVSISRGNAMLFAPWRISVRNQFLAYIVFALLCAFSLSSFERHRKQQRTVNQRLKLATEAAGVGIWEFEPDARKYHWDEAMFNLFGLDPAKVSNLTDDWKKLVLPGELDRIRVATRAVIKQRQPFDLTFQVRLPSGQVRFLRNRAALHVGDPDSPVRLIGTTEDVTERKTREADLRIAATAFESHESTVITDAQATIIRINQAFSKMYGYSAQDALGKTPKLLHSGRHDSAFYGALWTDLQQNHTWQGEVWNRRQNGELLLVWLSISAVNNEDGVVTHFVATHTDITQRKAAEDVIRQMAFYDPLTQLPNRRLLQDRLRQALALARRDGYRLALMFIDLDKFKPINDEFGHTAGDELLQAVAQRLRTCIRESDTLARVGGDEFVMLLPRIEAVQDALGAAEKIHTALRQPFSLVSGVTAHISSSTGIAIYPDHADDEALLTSHADAAMYRAKAAGRDRFVLFSPAAT